MAKLQLHCARLLLLVGIAALPAACSSSDNRSLVILHLTLDGDVTGIPTSIRLTALKDATEVRSTDVPWKPVNGIMQIGLFIPSGITGQVTIAAKGTTDANQIIEGQVTNVELKAGGSVGPKELVLAASGATGADGGTADAGVPGAEVNDNPVPDAAAPDVRPADALPDGPAQPDVASPVADAKDAKLPSDDVKDASPLPDVADAFVLPADGSDAIADAANPVEVGHTPAWEPAQNVENDVLNPSYSPAIVVDPIGEHVYVVWSEAVSIKVKRWNRLSGLWEKTVVVENRGGPNGPAIGADAHGNVLVTWGQNTGSATVDGAWASRTADGTTWSPPTRITPDPAFDMHLAVARNGTAHAVYNKQRSPGWPLFTAYYDGAGWTENPTTLDSNDSSADSEAQIGVSDTGDGLLIFHLGLGVAASALTGATYTPLFMLDPNYQDVSAYYQALAINRKGEGIALWSEDVGENSQMLGRTYSPSSGWSSVLPPIVTASIVAGTAVALDEQGSATVVWQQNLGSSLNLVGLHGSPTSSWSDAVPLETDNAAGSSGLTTEYAYPSVAIDGSGNVLTVWRKRVSATDATTYGAYGTRFAAGKWLPQAKLGLKTGFDVFNLNVSVADSGFGAAAFKYWSDTKNDPDADNVFVAFFR